MNIWAWVERVQDELRANGRERLAELMDLVPHYMSDNMHEQLDAVMPEALALAREAKNPWIEVFLRHWNLQSRILQRYEVGEFLSEAVNLIDFANRDETKNCPQSVCTTQDLANCYAHLDGPGFADERLAVASETLRRITPEWPCFTCISGEYATALLDAGKPEEALAFIESQKSELIRIGRADRKDEMVGTHIDALIALGRLEEALEMNQQALDLGRGESFVDFRRLDEARIQSRLGRSEEAKRQLLSFDEVARTPSQYEPYAEAIFHLAKSGGIPNDLRVQVELEQLVRNMRRNGVVRRAIQLALWQGRLAVLRDRPSSAKRSAEVIRELIPKLRLPLQAPADLADLEREIAELEARRPAPRPLPDDPGEVLAALSADPEIDREVLERALEKWPEDERIVLALASSFAALLDHDRAIERLLAHLAAHPDSPDVVLHLLHTFRGARRRRELEAFAAESIARSARPDVLAACHWALALDADDRGDKDEAKKRLEAVLELKPEAINSRLLLSRVERDLGDFEASLEHLERLVANAEPGPWDWDRMLIATLLDRWDAVRHSANRIGMKLEGTGPIDIDGELIRIELGDRLLDDDRIDGDPATYYAIRTGPVTARIVEIAHPAHEQHFGDRVAFDARPKNEAPPEGEAENHTFIYPAVRIVRRGGYWSSVIDGVHPGEERLKSLRDALQEIGCRLELRSDSTYTIRDEAAGARRLGLYAFVAIPRALDPKRVHAVLGEKTRDLADPLVWVDLARRAGDTAAADAHAKIAERYQLY
jgi:tetratricopeptide (TPR) repeat protein